MTNPENNDWFNSIITFRDLKSHQLTDKRTWFFEHFLSVASLGEITSALRLSDEWATTLEYDQNAIITALQKRSAYLRKTQGMERSLRMLTPHKAGTGNKEGWKNLYRGDEGTPNGRKAIRAPGPDGTGLGVDEFGTWGEE